MMEMSGIMVLDKYINTFALISHPPFFWLRIRIFYGNQILGFRFYSYHHYYRHVKMEILSGITI